MGQTTYQHLHHPYRFQCPFRLLLRPLLLSTAISKRLTNLACLPRFLYDAGYVFVVSSDGERIQPQRSMDRHYVDERFSNNKSFGNILITGLVVVVFRNFGLGENVVLFILSAPIAFLYKQTGNDENPKA